LQIFSIKKYISNPHSHHERKVVVANTVAHVNCTTNVGVASVISHKSGPLVVAEGGESSCDVALDAPGILNTVLAHGIKATIII